MRICMTHDTTRQAADNLGHALMYPQLRFSEWPTETTPSRRQCRPARLGEGCVREASAFPRMG